MDMGQLMIFTHHECSRIRLQKYSHVQLQGVYRTYWMSCRTQCMYRITCLVLKKSPFWGVSDPKGFRKGIVLLTPFYR